MIEIFARSSKEGGGKEAIKMFLKRGSDTFNFIARGQGLDLVEAAFLGLSLEFKLTSVCVLNKKNFITHVTLLSNH